MAALVADFDARDGAWKFGVASTPQWLSFHCGLAHRTAVEHLRAARRRHAAVVVRRKGPTLLVKDENVLDVGRAHRLVTRKQYRALLRRHGGCYAHPGCPNTTKLHAHHVIAWLVAGPTNLDNLILLCERHHVSLHDGAYRIRKLGNRAFRFETPDGVDLEHPIAAVPPSDLPSLETEHPALDPKAATTKWDGQRMQRDYAISVIAQRRYNATDSASLATAAG